MKNKYLVKGLLSLLPFFAGAQEISADATLGGRGCRGTGSFCNIQTDTSIVNNRNTENSENHTLITLKKLDNNVVKLIVPLNTIDKQKQKLILGKDAKNMKHGSMEYYKLEDDLVLNEPILNQLNIDKSLNLIKGGKYPMVLKDNKIEITITLSK